MAKKTIISIVVLVVSMTLMAASPCLAGSKKKSDNGEQLLTRIDFGNAYITGQTLKSGAVYLLQRKKNEIKSMLKYRENYRREILEAYNLDDKDRKRRGE